MKDLTSGNLYKNFIVFAIPMVLSGVLSQGYSMVDTIIAGKLVGESALAAMGAIMPFGTFINSLFYGYGTGIGVYTAQLFGSHKPYRLKTVVINNMATVSAFVVFLSLLLLVFRYPIYSFLKIDGAILADADRYFTIVTAGKIFILFAGNSVFVLNALGESMFPFFMSLLSAVLNIGGNIASIVLLGMGVEGLALATVLSSLIVGICYCFRLRAYFRISGVHKHRVHWSPRVLKETFSYSAAVMFQQSIMSFSSMILSPLVNGLGSVASASYAVTQRVYAFNAMIYQNSSKTLGNYTAQCYGAKKYEQLRRGMAFGFLQSLIFVLPFLLVSVLCPRQITLLFFKTNSSETAIHYTILFLRFYLPFLGFNVAANLFHFFFRGIARFRLLLVSTFAGSAARILMSVLLIGPLGIHGIYIGWVFSWVFDALVGAWLYFFGKWRKELLAKKCTL